MTTPTPVAAIRQLAEEIAKRIMARTHASSGRAVFVDEIIIQQIVDEVATAEFAALREAQETATCETCRYAGDPNRDPEGLRFCSNLMAYVHPMTSKGQPFSCADWTAKLPAPPRAGEETT